MAHTRQAGGTQLRRVTHLTLPLPRAPLKVAEANKFAYKIGQFCPQKQYINPQGEVTAKPQYVYNQQNVPFQATDAVLLSFGWRINELPDPQPEPTEADLLRQQINNQPISVGLHPPHGADTPVRLTLNGQVLLIP